MMLDRAAGPWRASRREAEDDAIRAGEAQRDGNIAFLGVFASIQERRHQR